MEPSIIALGTFSLHVRPRLVVHVCGRRPRGLTPSRPPATHFRATSLGRTCKLNVPACGNWRFHCTNSFGYPYIQFCTLRDTHLMWRLYSDSLLKMTHHFVGTRQSNQALRYSLHNTADWVTYNYELWTLLLHRPWLRSLAVCLSQWQITASCYISHCSANNAQRPTCSARRLF